MRNKREIHSVFIFLCMVVFVCLTGITAKADVWVEAGSTITLRDDGMTNGTGYEKTWVSGDTSIASTSGNGPTCVVRGLKPGNVSIICHTHSWVTRRVWIKTGAYASQGYWGTETHDDFTTKTFQVEVRPVLTAVSLSKTTLALAVGGTDTITVTPVPAKATITGKSFTSSKPSVASVLNSGKVTGVSAGTAVITVKANDKCVAVCTVTVGPSTSGAGSGGSTASGGASNANGAAAGNAGAGGNNGTNHGTAGAGSGAADGAGQDTDWDGGDDALKLVLSKKSITMTVGQKHQLTAKVNGKKVKAKYKTGDGKIVSVDKNGNLKAKACGTVKIKAAALEGANAVCTVKVVPGRLKTLKASVKNGTVTLHWPKAKKISGYKIYRSGPASGKFKAVKTIKASQKSAVLKNHKKGSCYYKVCPYKKINGKMYISPASKAVTASVKVK